METKKLKRVKKSIVKNEITFDDYKKCLDDKIIQFRSMNLVRIYKYNLYTVEMNTIVLNVMMIDHKICVLEDGIFTLSHGHCKLKN